MTRALSVLNEEQIEHFQREGYLIVKGLFSEQDVRTIEEKFEEISQKAILKISDSGQVWAHVD